MLWLHNLPAMGMNWTLGILFGVLPRRGDRRTGMALVAVGTGLCGSVGVIGGTVPGTLLRVMRRWTLFLTSALASSLDLVHSLWEVRLTFGKGLAMLLFKG